MIYVGRMQVFGSLESIKCILTIAFFYRVIVTKLGRLQLLNTSKTHLFTNALPLVSKISLAHAWSLERACHIGSCRACYNCSGGGGNNYNLGFNCHGGKHVQECTTWVHSGCTKVVETTPSVGALMATPLSPQWHITHVSSPNVIVDLTMNISFTWQSKATMIDLEFLIPALFSLGGQGVFAMLISNLIQPC